MKTAIIIGATSGIGQEVAARLVAEGWRVGITGRRSAALEAFQEKYGHDRVCIATMDVTRPESVQALDTLLEQTGEPDLFFYVSGVGYQNRELDEEKEIKTVRTNCEGMVRMVDHFFNYVRTHSYSKSHKANIAVITSVAGTGGLGTAPAYSATKKMQSTYLTALSQLSRMEKVPVVFTDIRPGFVATEILGPEFDYPIVMPVEKAADHILKGIRKKRRVFTFDWKFRLISVIWRLIPRALWERMTFVRI